MRAGRRLQEHPGVAGAAAGLSTLALAVLGLTIRSKAGLGKTAAWTLGFNSGQKTPVKLGETVDMVARREAGRSDFVDISIVGGRKTMKQLRKEFVAGFKRGHSVRGIMGFADLGSRLIGKNAFSYPGKPVQMSHALKEKYRIQISDDLPDFVAARYLDTKDIILLPDNQISRQLLEHELTHRDWWWVYSPRDKLHWKRIMRSYPELRQELWTDYIGSSPDDQAISDEEILADLVSQFEVGKLRNDLPRKVEKEVRRLAAKQMLPDPPI